MVAPRGGAGAAPRPARALTARGLTLWVLAALALIPCALTLPSAAAAQPLIPRTEAGDTAGAPDPRRPPQRPCDACVHHFVAPDGDDGDEGSANAPWRTLQHAADRVEPGDVVQVRPGKYRGFDLRKHGEPLRPIWFVAEPGVVVYGNNHKTPDGINVEAASWVGIVGFRVTGAGRAGIRAVDCDSVTIAANETIDNQRWGIFTGFCNNLVIEDNEAAGSLDEHGIYVSNSPENAVVRRNLIHDNRQCGLHMNGDLSAGGHGMIKNALVDSNVIFRVGEGGGAGINCDGIQGSTIRNNLIFDAHAHGITLYRIDGAEGSKRNTVSHNTIVVADDGRYALHIHHGSTHNRVSGNLLLTHHAVNGSLDVAEDSLEGLESDGNVVVDRFTLDDWETVIDWPTWRERTGLDARSHLVSGPAEVLGEGFAPIGAALDAAAGPAPDVDLRGFTRPVGAAPDLGAIEACEGAGCVPVAPIQGTRPLGQAPPAAALAPPTGGCAGCAAAPRGSPPWAPLLLGALAALGLRPKGRSRRPRA